VPRHLMAMALAGLPTPAWTFNGADVKKQV
jgi:hypothetical protein